MLNDPAFVQKTPAVLFLELEPTIWFSLSLKICTRIQYTPTPLSSSVVLYVSTEGDEKMCGGIPFHLHSTAVINCFAFNAIDTANSRQTLPIQGFAFIVSVRSCICYYIINIVLKHFVHTHTGVFYRSNMPADALGNGNKGWVKKVVLLLSFPFFSFFFFFFCLTFTGLTYL